MSLSRSNGGPGFGKFLQEDVGTDTTDASYSFQERSLADLDMNQSMQEKISAVFLSDSETRQDSATHLPTVARYSLGRGRNEEITHITIYTSAGFRRRRIRCPAGTRTTM